nr:homeodomain-like protein [Tanacetum cinerariifolium]
LQENFDLFNHMKNNINAILNDIRYIPGPPLPVSLNEDLAHNILPTTSQSMMHDTSRGMHMKQEPRF